METPSKASLSFTPAVTQGAGAVPAFGAFRLQAPSAEKVAVIMDISKEERNDKGHETTRLNR